MSKRATKHRRPKPWPLAKLYAECRAAPVVWLALEEMALQRGSSIVTPTRQQIAEATGIERLRTVSTALTALEYAEWLERIHVPVTEGRRRTATLLRLVLLRKGQKSTHTKKSAVWVKNRPKGKGQNLTQDSPTERGRPQTPPPPAGAEASAGRPKGTQPTEQTTKEHPATRIERERLEAIRAQRQEQEQGKEPATEGDDKPVSSVA